MTNFPCKVLLSNFMKSTSAIRHAFFDEAANIIGLAHLNGFTVIDASNCELLSDVKIKDDKTCPYGCSLIATFGLSNIIAVTNFEFNTNTVYIWDRYKAKLLVSCLFDGPITGIKLRTDIIIGSTQKAITVKNLSDNSIIAHYDTAFNRDGIFDLSPFHLFNLIVFPASETGVIGLMDIYDKSIAPRYVHCFKTSILGIKVSQNGRQIAVVGDEGRQVIVFNYPSLQIVARLKRGTSSRINSISFDEHRNRLAIIDNTESFQVFDLHQQTEENEIKPALKLKYSESAPIWIGFTPKNCGLVGITGNGSLFKVVSNSDEKGASCEQIGSRLRIK